MGGRLWPLGGHGGRDSLHGETSFSDFLYSLFCWYHAIFCSGLFTARCKSFDSTIYLIRARLREWGNSRKFLVYTNFLIQN